VDHVFRVFAKDLGTVTLHDSRQRIIDNIETLIMEVETTAEARQVRVQRAYLDPWTGLMCSGAEATLSPPAGRPTVSLAGLTLLRLFLDKLSLATQLPGRPDLSLPEPLVNTAWLSIYLKQTPTISERVTSSMTLKGDKLPSSQWLSSRTTTTLTPSIRAKRR
jgi:hypothetical protein